MCNCYGWFGLAWTKTRSPNLSDITTMAYSVLSGPQARYCVVMIIGLQGQGSERVNPNLPSGNWLDQNQCLWERSDGFSSHSGERVSHKVELGRKHKNNFIHCTQRENQISYRSNVLLVHQSINNAGWILFLVIQICNERIWSSVSAFLSWIFQERCAHSLKHSCNLHICSNLNE